METQSRVITVNIDQDISEDDQHVSYKNFIKTLSSIGESTSKQERLQAKHMHKQQLLTRILGYPSMILSALIVFNGIAQFSRHSGNPECSQDLWLQITNTVFGLALLFFTVTNNFFSPDKKYARHEHGVKTLRAFFSTVDTYRMIDRKTRHDRMQVINGLRDHFNAIMEDIPTIGSETEQLKFSIQLKDISSDSSTSSMSDDYARNPEAHREIERMCASNMRVEETPNLNYQLNRLREN